MRPLELTFSILTLAAGALALYPRTPAWIKARGLPAALALAGAAQLTLKGFRWQLWPLFLGGVLLILFSLRQLSRRVEVILAGTAALFSLLSLAGGALLPVPVPFPITGPYLVGTREIELVDPTRQEIYGEDPGGPREFTAQIWYPAAPTADDQRAPWMPAIEGAGPVIARDFGLPPFALGHLQHVEANAFLGAPPASTGGPFPTLIFSHGWEGFKEQNIYQVEELASHGYVVVGIKHTYGAVLTVFPDGRQLPSDQDALPAGVSQSAYDRASDRLSEQWAGDIGWTLDELARWNGDGEWFLAGRLDLNTVGVLGHSTGGGAAVRFCLTDTRCDAVLGMDVWAEPIQRVIAARELTRPAAFLYSENWDSLDHPQRNYGLMGDLVDEARGEVTEITIAGTKHADFSALPLLSPLAPALGWKGPIDGELVLEIINAESVAFFDRYLLQETGPSLEEVSGDYPEALYGVRP